MKHKVKITLSNDSVFFLTCRSKSHSDNLFNALAHAEEVKLIEEIERESEHESTIDF